MLAGFAQYVTSVGLAVISKPGVAIVSATVPSVPGSTPDRNKTADSVGCLERAAAAVAAAVCSCVKKTPLGIRVFTCGEEVTPGLGDGFAIPAGISFGDRLDTRKTEGDAPPPDLIDLTGQAVGGKHTCVPSVAVGGNDAMYGWELVVAFLKPLA